MTSALVATHDVRRFVDALLKAQEQETALSRNPTPLDVWRPVTDRAAFRKALKDSGKARDDVVGLFGAATGSTRKEAKKELDPLFIQVSLLKRFSWDDPEAWEAWDKATGRLQTRDPRVLGERARAVYEAAVETLAAFYLNRGHTEDPLLAATQATWSEIHARRRLLGQRNGRPQWSRYFSLWHDWASGKTVTNR
jgi:hypothetical protein